MCKKDIKLYVRCKKDIKLYVRCKKDIKLYVRCKTDIKLYVRCKKDIRLYVRCKKDIKLYVRFKKDIKLYVRCKEDIKLVSGLIKTWASGGRQRPQRRPDSFLERFAMGGKDIPLHSGERRQRKISDLRYWTHFYVDPSDSFYYRWLAVISLAVLYNVVFIIARSVFWELQNQFFILWLSLDYISDFIYALDIFIQFRTGKCL
ncbi:Cyclic nucleotide-gated olfactory channel [Bulinus truncatus]|nr:Cyclic nucleotide-gated olfactory channel [Bulinus truncatus]